MQNLKLPGVIPTIHALSNLVNDMANFSAKHPKVAGGIAEGAVGTGFLATLFGAYKWLRRGAGAGAKGVKEALKKAPSAVETGAEDLAADAEKAIPILEQRASTFAKGSWEAMIQARGMQNTVLARIVANPAPLMRFLGMLADVANAIALFTYTKKRAILGLVS